MFDQCLYFNTTALARQLEREWADAFKAFGLTAPQAFVLRAVLKQPGLLQRELAAQMGISRPTATRSLDTLAEKGLIERHATPTDGRESAIHPTEAAVGMLTALDEASGLVTRRLKSVLGEASFTGTVAQLRAIRNALG
jgi:DNA-binding MarR family transcriptional regulator